jgi:hypothetical protein
MKRAVPLVFALAAALSCNEVTPVRLPGPTVAHPTGGSAVSPSSPASVAALSRRNPDARVVAFRILFDTGSSEDPTGKEGLTALTATMTVSSGTRDLTFAELSRALYPMAASIDAHVDRDQTVFEAEIAATDLPSFYPLLRDVILAPRLDDESFSRLLARQKSSLEDELKGADDETLGKEALQAFIYADHPYGHPTVGRPSANVYSARSASPSGLRVHFPRGSTRQSPKTSLLSPRVAVLDPACRSLRAPRAFTCSSSTSRALTRPPSRWVSRR